MLDELSSSAGSESARRLAFYKVEEEVFNTVRKREEDGLGGDSTDIQESRALPSVFELDRSTNLGQ